VSERAVSRMRDWPARHVVLTDLAAAVVLAGLTVGTEAGRGAGGSPWWQAVAWASFVPLAWRRRRPVAVAVIVAVAALVIFAAGQQLLAGSSFVALWVAVYSVAAQEPRRAALAAAAALEALGVATVARWAPGSAIVAGLVLTTGTAAAAVMLGINRQTRRAYLAALEERAARLEHERDQQARLAVADERARIAREVHDIVTHSLSVMVTLADGAAAVTAASPERATATIRQVAATGRQAIGEMRRIVGTLRTDDGGGGHPMPGLGDLDDLLAQVRDAGLPVRLTIQGQPHPLPAGVQLAIYRIIQESLTNVRKHAPESTGAVVTIRYGDDGIEAEIGNDGRTTDGGSSAGGHGLTGMRERAAAYDGSITAGPRPGGGWLVRARLGGDEDQ
jgi:signal transduction histidine kinase